MYVDFDVQDAKDANVMISNNGFDINRIQIRNGRIAAGGGGTYVNPGSPFDGIAYGGGLVYIPGSNHVFRGLEITDIKSFGNTLNDIDIWSREDAASQFISTDGGGRVEGRAGVTNIAGAVFADADFFSEIIIGQVRGEIQSLKETVEKNQGVVSPALEEWKRMKTLGVGISGLIALAGLTIGSIIAWAGETALTSIRHWLKIP